MEPFARNTKHFETDGDTAPKASMAEGAVKGLGKLMNYAVDALGAKKEVEVKASSEEKLDVKSDGPLFDGKAPHMEKARKLEAEGASLEDGIGDAPTEHPASAAEVETMTDAEAEAAAAKLRAQNAALEADIASQDKENEELRQRIAELEEVKALRAKNEEIEQSIEQQKKENDELERQVKAMEAKKAEGEKAAMLETGTEMETEEQEIARLTARNSFLEEDNAKVEKENAELADRIKETLNTRNSFLEEENKKQEDEIAELQKKIAMLETGNKTETEAEEAARLEARNKFLEEDNAKLDKEAAELEQRIQEMEEMKRLQQENEKMEADNANVEKENAEMEKRIAELEKAKAQKPAPQ